MLDDDSPLTLEDRVALLVNALAAERDHKPVVRLNLPGTNACWLLVECDPDEPEKIWSLCDHDVGQPELRYISLVELMNIRGPLGLPVERDAHFVAKKRISAYATEAHAKGRISA